MIAHITFNSKAVQTSDIDYNLTVSGNKCFPTSPSEEPIWVNQEEHSAQVRKLKLEVINLPLCAQNAICIAYVPVMKF